MACGNNKATRAMVVSMGGLVAVAATVDAAPSKQAALRQLVARRAGPEALDKSRVVWHIAERRESYVSAGGVERARTRGREERDTHVHVVRGADNDPNAVLVQQTEKRSKPGHREGILFLHNPSEARVKEAALELARTLRRKKGNRG
jgi:hypothetical protein